MNFVVDDQTSVPTSLHHQHHKQEERQAGMEFDEMDVETDIETSEVEVVSVGHGKVSAFAKGKSKVGADDITAISTSLAKNSTSGSIDMNNGNSSVSDLSYHNHVDDEDDDDDDDMVFDDGDDYEDEEEDDDDGNIDEYNYEEEDEYLAIQSQFDNVDLPPGVEASITWLKDPVGSGINKPSGTSTSSVLDPSESKRKSSFLDMTDSKKKATESSAAATTSSAATAESSSNGEVVDYVENPIVHKYKNFKQFGTVEDFSDHHYCRMGPADKQRPDPGLWAKKILEEWKILEKGLPDTIFVRVSESRMELLRAVILGPAGTPYHDGLFVFDCHFPSTYPVTPPMVYYYSGGLRLNPNLYECGKVCLSLLGTWSGTQDEMWIPGKSTMLQVLVSIQALILNAQPFFNEPGYESTYAGLEGDRRSRKYSEDVFILSLKTMMYTLRRPPKHFEDLVSGHFHARAHDILVACKAYADGATVGTVAVKDGVAEINQSERNASAEFRDAVRGMINILITNFTKFGSTDCEKFRTHDQK